MLSHPEALSSSQAGETRHFSYKVFGLNVDSEIDLPELVPAEYDSPDIRIRFGEVPDKLDNLVARSSWCMVSPSELLFRIDGTASYHIAAGRTITVQLDSGSVESVPASDIRLWLLGSAFGALLHQRGMLPWHVSAVKTPSGVWAFTADSGEGKSTLAAFLQNRFGWDLVSDDVAVIAFDRSGPVVFPGPRKLKLWADALDHLKISQGKSVRDLSNTEKFQLYMPDDGVCQPEPLAGLVVLESAPAGSESSVRRIRGAAAFSACCDAIYRPFFYGIYQESARLIEKIAPISQSIRVLRFSRPRSLDRFGTYLGPLLDFIETK